MVINIKRDIGREKKTRICTDPYHPNLWGNQSFNSSSWSQIKAIGFAPMKNRVWFFTQEAYDNLGLFLKHTSIIFHSISLTLRNAVEEIFLFSSVLLMNQTGPTVFPDTSSCVMQTYVHDWLYCIIYLKWFSSWHVEWYTANYGWLTENWSIHILNLLPLTNHANICTLKKKSSISWPN